MLDAEEPGIAGWYIRLFVVEAQPKPPIQEVETDRNGYYRFAGLPAGEYSVAQFGPPGDRPCCWKQTLPEPPISGQKVYVNENQQLTDVNFGFQLWQAEFHGQVFIDIAPAPMGIPIQAKIGETVCDEAVTEVGFASLPSYFLSIPPAEEKPGCGVEGAVVTFAVDGKAANETAIWQRGSIQALHLTLAPRFASFSGTAYVEGEPAPAGSIVKALVDGRVCGQAEISEEMPPGFYAFLIVPPAAMQPGCGSEGATVAFLIGETLANETAVWTPGFHRLHLTTGMPATPSAAPTVTPLTSVVPPTLTPSPTPTPTLPQEPVATPIPTLTPAASPSASPSPIAAAPALAAASIEGAAATQREIDWLRVGLLSGGGALVVVLAAAWLVLRRNLLGGRSPPLE